jgi:hypothetical protein
MRVLTNFSATFAEKNRENVEEKYRNGLFYDVLHDLVFFMQRNQIRRRGRISS